MLKTILKLFFVFADEGDYQITGITEFTAFVLITFLVLGFAFLPNHFATLRSRHHQYEYIRSEFVNQEKCENEIDHLQDISERMMVILHVCRQLDGELLPPIGKDADSSPTQCQPESSSEEVRQKLSLELDEAWKSLGAGAIFINYNDKEGTGNHFCGVEHHLDSSFPSAFESLSLYDRANLFLTGAEHLLLDDKVCTVQDLSSLYDAFLNCATCRLDHLDVGKNDARKQRRKRRHRKFKRSCTSSLGPQTALRFFPCLSTSLAFAPLLPDLCRALSVCLFWTGPGFPQSSEERFFRRPSIRVTYQVPATLP